MIEQQHVEQEEQLAPYVYYEAQVSKRIHHFYINREIDAPHFYIDMVHKILSAGEEDVIHIHLNTPGGRLDTGVQIINALQMTKAHVITSIEARCDSLGTFIFLVADEYIVHDNCMMMFHNFSGGTWGKGHEQVAQLDATIRWYNDLARKLCVPFLTPEEFDRIIKGEDIYFHSDEIRKRLERMVRQLKQQHKESAPRATKKAKKAKEHIENTE
jgi:ATP-dependent protease ClpP protease subunit